jgi:hypothetical protein
MYTYMIETSNITFLVNTLLIKISEIGACRQKVRLYFLLYFHALGSSQCTMSLIVLIQFGWNKVVVLQELNCVLGVLVDFFALVA